MLDLILAVSLYLSPTADSPVCEPGQVSEIDDCVQGQLPEEHIGRMLEIEGQWYVVTGIDENGDDILELIHEDSPLWDCTIMGNHVCGELVDGVWYNVYYDENGCEYYREPQTPIGIPTGEEITPIVEPTPAPTEPAVVPTDVTEILDAVQPKEPELAETGDASGMLFFIGIVLFGMGLAAKAGAAWARQRGED